MGFGKPGRAAALVLAFLCMSSAVLAQVAEDNQRYEFFLKGGKLYRADKVTGSVEQVPLPDEVTVKPHDPKPSLARPPAPPNRGPVIEAVCGEGVGPGASPVDSLAPRVILDADRQRAEKDIQAYRGQLGLIQALNLQNGRIKGVISVTNKGPRKLEALELALTAASQKDGETAVEHYFVMGYRPDQK